MPDRLQYDKGSTETSTPLVLDEVFVEQLLQRFAETQQHVQQQLHADLLQQMRRLLHESHADIMREVALTKSTPRADMRSYMAEPAARRHDGRNGGGSSGRGAARLALLEDTLESTMLDGAQGQKRSAKLGRLSGRRSRVLPEPADAIMPPQDSAAPQGSWMRGDDEQRAAPSGAEQKLTDCGDCGSPIELGPI